MMAMSYEIPSSGRKTTGNLRLKYCKEEELTSD